MENHLAQRTAISKFHDEAGARQQCTTLLWNRLFRPAPQNGRPTRHVDDNMTAVPELLVEKHVTGRQENLHQYVEAHATRKSGSLECPALATSATLKTPLRPAPTTAPEQSAESSPASPYPTPVPDRTEAWPDGDGTSEASLSASPFRDAHGVVDEEDPHSPAPSMTPAHEPMNVVAAKVDTPDPTEGCDEPVVVVDAATALAGTIGGGGESARPVRQTESLALAEAEYEVPSPTSIQRRTFLSRKRERTPSVPFPDFNDGLVFSPHVRVGRSRGHSTSLSVSRPSLVWQPLRSRTACVFVAGPDGLVRTPSPVPRASLSRCDDSDSNGNDNDELNEEVAEEEQVAATEEEEEVQPVHERCVDMDACELPSAAASVPRVPASDVMDAEDNAAPMVVATLFAEVEDRGSPAADPRALPGQEAEVRLPPSPPLAPFLTACEEEDAIPVCVPLYATDEELPRLLVTEVELPSRVSIDLTAFEWVDEAEAVLRAQQHRLASASPVPRHPTHSRVAHPSAEPQVIAYDEADSFFSLPHVSFHSLSRPPPPTTNVSRSPQRGDGAVGGLARSPSLLSSSQTQMPMQMPMPMQTWPHERVVEEAKAASLHWVSADRQGSSRARGGGVVSDEGDAQPASCVRGASRQASPAARAHDETEAELAAWQSSPSCRRPEPRTASENAPASLAARAPSSSKDTADRRDVSHPPALSSSLPPPVSVSPPPLAPVPAPSSAAFRFTSRVHPRLPGGRHGGPGAGPAPSHREKPSLLPRKTPSSLPGRRQSVSQTRALASAVVPVPPRLATSERAQRGMRVHNGAAAKASGREPVRPSVQFELPKTLAGSHLSERPVNAPTTAMATGKKRKKNPTSNADSTAPGPHQKVKKRKLQ